MYGRPARHLFNQPANPAHAQAACQLGMGAAGRPIGHLYSRPSIYTPMLPCLSRGIQDYGPSPRGCWDRGIRLTSTIMVGLLCFAGGPPARPPIVRRISRRPWAFSPIRCRVRIGEGAVSGQLKQTARQRRSKALDLRWRARLFWKKKIAKVVAPDSWSP